ncbi:Zinc finger, PHD-type [Sesbania bispinosa]|nr:Zinc finger, PHD-type [Sesbania bispinosa]
MRLESGTCNVCSAPCSSCMHLNRAFMGSKAEEYSDENCRSGEANQYSTDEGDGSSLRSRACERSKHAVSETSNMPSVYSSHDDSLSENAESKQALSEKYQDSKCLEGLDDSTSCISRASKANLESGNHQINSDRINISCSSASASHLGAEGSRIGPSVDMSGSSEILSSKDADIVENLSECCMENVESALTKEGEPIIVTGEKSPADNDISKIHPKSEADTDNDVGGAKDEDHKYSAHDGLHEKAEELVKSPSMPVPQSEDESDESDVVEHDVKVCDICGDSGRDDLLAFCCRCSDGAEHTYCMRVMLDKVPEGDWLCEECQYAEETANQRLDVEGKKSHKVSSTSQISGKRPSESVEVATASKRQALESSSGSPKASSPKRIVPLSRESSSKSLDNGKVKPGQQIPIRNRPGGDGVELARSLSTGPRSQTARGALLKSNSFNSFNSKPRVKHVDEVVPQKQKGGVEHISKNMETPAGMISKSMSFKSSNLGRATESKVKMLSPKSVTAQDLKGSRHAKESGVSDRKFLSRIDRPVICSTMASSVVSPKGDQKLTPRGETAKPSAVNNNREPKVNQDGKLSSLSKSMNNISHKSPEPQVISERTSTSVYETKQDGLPRARETANQVDKTKDSSIDRVRSSVTNASKSSFCHKCKDFGHPTECCTIGGTQESGAEVSVTATISSKVEMHTGNKLKAAIQAALLRRPELHKKKDVPDQTDEFPTSGTDMKSAVSSQDQVLVSYTSKNSISAEETNARQEILENSTFETCKHSSGNDLKHNFCPTDFSFKLRKSDSEVPASGKLGVRDLPHCASAISSVISKMSAIPEYEYIWQGVFEVHRSGKPPDLYTGIQAHLSSCASPKVLDAVSKFLPQVSLHEVSRLSTWPSQFHQGGAKEDNIALYFFAKDIESYERHYKRLLDHMIRNDLALKGMFDGVELLIFTSNQLPENLQRWNMLFFLWGIFRGRRINHSDSEKKNCIPSLNVIPNEKDFPTAVMTLSETLCSPKRMDEESIASGKACSAVNPSTSIDQGHIMVSRNFDMKETIFDQTHLGSQVNLERQDSRIDTKSMSRIPTSSAQLCQEMNSTGSSLKGSESEHGQYSVCKPPEAMGTSVRSTIEESKTDYDISVEQENSMSSRIPYVGTQEISTANSISKDEISERTNNDENQRRPKRKQIEDDLNINVEAAFQGDLTIKGVNCQLPNDKKVKNTDLSGKVMEAAIVSCQKTPWNKVYGKLGDSESSSKLQTGFSGVYGCYSSGAKDSYNGSFASLVNDFGSCSSVEDKGCKEACDEKIIHEDLGTMERTFFPVDAHNKNDSQLVLNSMSLKGPNEYRDQFQVGIPNLELALGGEAKQSQKGMLPFFVGADDKKNNQEKTPDLLEDEQEDDSVAASLSLSLSFPSSNMEHTKPASKAEHLPDGHHVNTSLLLFGRFTDK